MMTSQYFLHFYDYLVGFTFLVLFFVWKAYQNLLPCQNYASDQQSKAWKILSTKPKIITKWPLVRL